MKIDFSHPANAAVLRYLRNPYDFITGETARIFKAARDKDLANSRHLESQSPDSINWLNLGTHPDIVERFWKEITALLPEPCSWVVYGAPILAHPGAGIIFGWAGGTHSYALRLPPTTREEALKAGAKRTREYRYAKSVDTIDLSSVGEEWVFGNWIKGEEDWCLSAYRHAGTLA